MVVEDRLKILLSLIMNKDEKIQKEAGKGHNFKKVLFFTYQESLLSCERNHSCLFLLLDVVRRLEVK